MKTMRLRKSLTAKLTLFVLFSICNGASAEQDPFKKANADGVNRKPLCMMNADGTGLRVVADMGEGIYAGSPRVSFDSKHITFDVWIPKVDSSASMSKVYVVHVDGKDLIELGLGSMPSWAPNNRQITFFRHKDFGLWVIDRDGSGLERLNKNGNSPRWSPDGKQLAFNRRGQKSGICIFDPETGEEQLVAPEQPQANYHHGFDWSPDGKRICAQYVANTHEIRLIDVENDVINTRWKSETLGHSLAWSPDGSNILFWMKGLTDKHHQLYMLNPDTDDPPEKLSGQPTDRDNVDPCWSPDGRIVFASGLPNEENG